VIERDELAAWLALLETPGVGRTSARRLLAAFGSAQAAVHAPVAQRLDVVGAAAAEALGAPSPALETLIEATWAWLGRDEAGPARIVTLADAAYPPLLLEVADPPLMLYCLGDISLLRRPNLAVVGSRNPTPQGRDNARAFAAALSDQGLTITSGLALGIDGQAHEGGLAGAASTIAVIGTGLDIVYPRQHRALARRIADRGLMVSEYALGTPSLAQNFPQRNRIIAGLSRGTLVVEAALQSGSLITARLANEAGREVFAIPGSIHSPQSRGCHALLRQGAKLVESAADVLEELHWGATPAAAAQAAPPEENSPTAQPVLDAMAFDPITLDQLVERTGIGAAQLNVQLLELELEGRVARLPGQRFQRIARG
jgi:DNA processing protein